MRWLPRSLFGRIALLLTFGLVVAQLAGTAIHMNERQRLLTDMLSREFAHQVAAMYRAVQAQPVGRRAELAGLLNSARFSLGVQETEPAGRPAAAGTLQGLQRELQLVVGQPVVLLAPVLPAPPLFEFDVYLQLDAGQWLRVQGKAPDEIMLQPWHAFLGLGMMLLVVIVLVMVSARSTVRPLTRLASAAHSLADNLNHPPLPETGPLEVKDAARAFNTMQRRIRSGIEERERFLAAVSHDLKTPVTRLQLRAEMLNDPRVSADIRRDVDDMQQLINDALDFLRGKSVQEPVQPVDLVALVESVADDFSDRADIALNVPDALRFEGRPKALQRALRNLVENAVKYSGSARISLVRQHNKVVLVVDDDGEGIPAEHLEHVFEPFYRVEGSRSRDTGGTGLGLAIVQQVAVSHGGVARLENRSGGGLRAVLELPA